MLLPILGWFALLKPAYPPIPVFPLIVNERKIEDTGLGGVCHCLRSAEQWTGKPGGWGTANNVPANSGVRVGSIILMYQQPYGHAGAVTVYTDNTVTFKETGWVGCNTVDYRTLSRDDDSIRGYYN